MMCGRYTLYARPEDVIRDYKLGILKQQLIHSYNIAPSQLVSVVIADAQQRALTNMRWGLIPSWQNQHKPIPQLHNARLETIDTKPSFRHAFRRQRCLILANGFYEWDQTTKQPYYIQTKMKTVFAMAGIWEAWAVDKDVIYSCCIITQAPNKTISAYHDRMPAILQENNYDAWLDSNHQGLIKLKNLLMPLTDENTSLYPVSTLVNSPKYNSPNCIEQTR